MDSQEFRGPVRRERLYTRYGQLKIERATWWAHWADITTHLLPRAGRYFRQDRNKGWRRHNAIYDSTGLQALRVLGAGLMGGATSPARPWFRLGTADPDLAKQHDVKVWLADVTQLMEAIFQKSNTYRSLHQGYEELGAFGTFADVILPDFKNVIHHYPFTVGEYCIATDYQGRVCTLYREFERPVSEVVKEFGLENCSEPVKRMFAAGTLDTWVPMIHAIEPRQDRDPKGKTARDMPWASYYFEVAGDKEKLLRESGFKYFPAVCPRWAVSGGDIYGNSPGMEALGDIKQLQHEQLRKAQGIDYLVRPPLQVPTTLKNREVDSLPGGVTYYDGQTAAPIKSMFEARIDLSHLLEDIQDVRARIRGCFFTDMFLMLGSQQETRMTATEVAERHEEKLLMIGPVLERLHNELLQPLVETTFQRMVEAGIVPQPPESMRGAEISVEFISMLAQAQRAVAANSVDRYAMAIGQIAQFKPDVLDKFDSDYWADAYADMLGVDPEFIVSGDKVAVIRQQRAEQQQQAQDAALAEQKSKTARNLAASPVGGGNALEGALSQFSGYS